MFDQKSVLFGQQEVLLCASSALLLLHWFYGLPNSADFDFSI
jgi:hypothetical protein